MDWLKGTGRLIYDPYRAGLKTKTKWWCVIDVDKSITKYYRWWIRKELHIKELCQPSWNAHVSVIRGEKPQTELMHLWKKYHGEIVEFQYEHRPYCNGQFWLVDVVCPRAVEIRKELERPTNWRQHLTVGRVWY